jgi:hypothetical protein
LNVGIVAGNRETKRLLDREHAGKHHGDGRLAQVRQACDKAPEAEAVKHADRLRLKRVGENQLMAKLLPAPDDGDPIARGVGALELFDRLALPNRHLRSRRRIECNGERANQACEVIEEVGVVAGIIWK